MDFNKNISPASYAQIGHIAQQAYAFAVSAKPEEFGRGRGVHELLTPGVDYAELPGLGGRSAKEIIEQLPAGAAVLDVGCGYGQLGAEIVQTLNPGISVCGFDAQAQPGQERLAKVAIGAVDELSPETFGAMRFELIVSSALLYHLPDYWGALLRMSRLLQQGGLLLASTMPRIVGTQAMHYYRNRNVFNTKGDLLSPEELVELLGEANPHMALEYSLATAPLSAVANVGGRIAMQCRSQEALDLENLFYCLCDGEAGYVSAKNKEEAAQLQQAHFVSVGGRLLV